MAEAPRPMRLDRSRNSRIEKAREFIRRELADMQLPSQGSKNLHAVESLSKMMNFLLTKINFERHVSSLFRHFHVTTFCVTAPYEPSFLISETPCD